MLFRSRCNSPNGNHSLLDGNYDLIGFDPRGTGNTIPFSCGDASDVSAEASFRHMQSAATANSSPESNVDPLVDPTDDDFEALMEYLQSRTIEKELAEECYHYQNATGEYIGTWSVAQDMLAIADALGQGPLLNYWGKSLQDWETLSLTPVP